MKLHRRDIVVLFVCISVLMIVSGLVGRRGHEVHNRVVCLSNMRQIGNGVLAHREETGYFPQSIGPRNPNISDPGSDMYIMNTWWARIATYINWPEDKIAANRDMAEGTIAHCPSHNLSKIPYVAPSNFVSLKNFTYHGNGWLMTNVADWDGPQEPVSSIKSPSKKVLNYEIFMQADWPTTWDYGSHYWRGQYAYPCTTGHRHLRNCLMNFNPNMV